MLADGKLNSLDTRLEQFKLRNANGQDELQAVLRDYAQLIEDYKSLKRSADQEANGVLVNDAEGSDKPRNPYILVLIDGNGYIFNDELVRDKEEGGMRAARMLNDAIEKYIREYLPKLKNTRVIVRIYADLTNLSKQLAKVKLTGLEKRSLAPFSAAFTRAIHLFDFVDALDEEGTKFKVRESFKLAAEDGSCNHILYAACHDASYLSELSPYAGARNKITLVQGADFNSEFHKLNLGITQFPTIFRWSGLSSATPTKTALLTTERNGTTPKSKTTTNKKSQNYHAIQNEVSWRSNNDTGFGADNGNDSFAESANDGWGTNSKDTKSSETPCKYFQKGFCRWGNKCKFQHAPNHMLPQEPPKPAVERTNLSNILPNHPVPGFIPLNKDDERLDIYIPPPTPESWLIYNGRFHRQKPCNDHHLQGACVKFNCPYDHAPLEPQARYCLEYVLKCSPCPRRGACRSGSCFYGHLCQKDGCMGQMKGCKMKADLHHVDPHAKKMVPVEEDDVLFHENLVDIEGDGINPGDANPVIQW